MRRQFVACSVGWSALVAAGCVSQARVELSAADALEQVAGETRKALDEYERDLESADASREAAVMSAFVARARRDHSDEALMARHTDEFTTALGNIREDRRVALERHRRATDNCAALSETAAGLRRIALEATSLDDELRRYVTSLFERRATKSDSEAGQK